MTGTGTKAIAAKAKNVYIYVEIRLPTWRGFCAWEMAKRNTGIV
jgi:hypothetical protein